MGAGLTNDVLMLRSSARYRGKSTQQSPEVAPRSEEVQPFVLFILGFVDETKMQAR